MAGRKTKNVVDYFPHYAHSGKTMFILESKYGNDGYTIWYKTLEILAKSEYHFLDLREENELLYITSKLKTTEDVLISIYELMAKLEAIDQELWEKRIVYSENFVIGVSPVYDRRNQKCLHKSDICSMLFDINVISDDINSISDDINTGSRVEYSKVEESKANSTPSFNEILAHANTIKAINETQKAELLNRYNSWVSNDWKDREGIDIRNYWKAKIVRLIPYLTGNVVEPEKTKKRKNLGK